VNPRKFEMQRFLEITIGVAALSLAFAALAQKAIA
jgi:hypothetical protein